VATFSFCTSATTKKLQKIFKMQETTKTETETEKEGEKENRR
jgi:hypothetical protein